VILIPLSLQLLPHFSLILPEHIRLLIKPLDQKLHNLPLIPTILKTTLLPGAPILLKQLPDFLLVPPHRIINPHPHRLIHLLIVLLGLLSHNLDGVGVDLLLSQEHLELAVQVADPHQGLFVF
jgi:hypothetical protein